MSMWKFSRSVELSLVVVCGIGAGCTRAILHKQGIVQDLRIFSWSVMHLDFTDFGLTDACPVLA